MTDPFASWSDAASAAPPPAVAAQGAVAMPADPNVGATVTYDPGDGSGPKTSTIVKSRNNQTGFLLANGDNIGSKLVTQMSGKSDPFADWAVPQQKQPAQNPIQAAVAENPLDTPQAIGQGMLNGATLGLGDKMLAAGQAAYDAIRSGAPFGQQFTENAQLLSALRGEETRQHPYAEIAGNVAGSFLPGGAVAKFLPKVPATLAAAPKAAAIGAGVGAGFGGAQAANESDWSNPQQVLTDAARGAAQGAALGAPLGALPQIVSPALRVLGEMGVGPKTSFGPSGIRATQSQATNAGNIIRENVGEASDITNAIEALQPDLVQGEEPTLGQVIPTPRTVAVEETLKRGPAKPNFLARAEENNTAGLAQIDRVQPNGNPYSVGKWAANRLKALNDEAAAQTQSAVENTQASTGAIPNAVPSQVGATARGEVASARIPVTQEENRLWSALNGYGMAPQAVHGAVDSWLSGLTQTERSALTPEENRAINLVASWKNVVPFDEIRALSSQLGDVARAASIQGNRQTARRVGMLRDALHDALGNAIDAEGAQAAVPEDSAYAKLLRERDQFVSGREGESLQSQGYAGGGAGDHPGIDTAARLGVVRGAGRAEGQTGGGPSASPGNQGLAGLQPLGPAQLADYQAARTFSRNKIETFDHGVPGDILARGERPSNAMVGGESVNARFDLADPELPGRIWNTKPTQVEDAAQFLRAGGSKQTLADAAALSFRDSGAIKPDGTLDVPRAERWSNQYRHLLAEHPDIAAPFQSARSAQLAVDDAAFRRAVAIKQFETSAARHFLGDRDPMDSVRRVFGAPDSAKEFLQLAKAVRGNADAEAGLRRSVVDYLIDRFQTSRPTSLGGNDFLSAAKFRDFVDAHGRALRVLFGGQGRQNLERVAGMLRRQQYSAEVAKGSQTAAAQIGLRGLGIGEHGGGHPTAMAVIGDQLGELVGHASEASPVIGKLVGIATGAGSLLASALRRSGIATRNELLAEAFLHPELAAELAQKAANGKISTIGARLIAGTLALINSGNSTRQKDIEQ